MGGQNGGDSDVVIEVPLNDGTTVYIKGEYDSYGSVKVQDYTFYPEQFRDYFEGWLDRESDTVRSKIFLAKRIWTLSYYDCEDNEREATRRSTECVELSLTYKVNVGTNTISKCIRADKDLNILSDDEKQKKRIEQLKLMNDAIRKELGRSDRP